MKKTFQNPNTPKRIWESPLGHRNPRRGQAVVEMALASVLLALLLAAALDVGRAYYTSVVVTNMAGEGALYAADNPDRDISNSNPGTCSREGVVAINNIQDRARLIATQRGLVISQPSQSSIRIQPANCALRCNGTPITVTVSYRMDDLFLPRMLGASAITITKSSSLRITENSFAAQQSGACVAP